MRLLWIARLLLVSGASSQLIDTEAQLEPRACAADNVLRALRNPKSSAGASLFCSKYIQSTVSATATAYSTVVSTVPGKTVEIKSPTTTLTLQATTFGSGLIDFGKRSVFAGEPTELATYPVSRISSACSCFLTTPPPPATTTAATTTLFRTTASTDRKVTTTVTVYSTTRVVPIPQCPQAQVPTPGSLAYPLRVEGFAGTIFEGTLDYNWVESTYGDITLDMHGTDTTGPCDGTGQGVNPTPGNTPLNTLYHAAVNCPLYLQGIYDTARHEGYIYTIGDTTEPDGGLWPFLVDYQLTPFLACDTEITPQNDVLWAYSGDRKSFFLKLSASATAVAVGKKITFHVSDGRTGVVIDDALVADGTTSAKGNYVYTCPQEGYFAVKAERADSVRSNRVYFYCFTPDSGHYI